MSVKGTILRADVSGKVMVKALLSGMPDCKFGMNDKVLMEKEPPKPGVNPTANTGSKGITIDDLKFHPCVVLPKFDKGKIFKSKLKSLFKNEQKELLLLHHLMENSS